MLIALLSFSFGVEILSKTLHTDEDGNIVAEGDVEADYEQFLVRADRIRYDPKERTVFASGRVYLRRKDGTFEIEGSEAFLDLKTEEGYFLDAEGKFRSFYFTAKRIRKLSGENYVVEEGDITTCPPDRKEMKVCFWKAKVDDRYVLSYSNSLTLFNLPIAYSPIVVLPVGERRSGLLPPMIGQNTYNNLIYIQPLYWAISEDKDATFTLDFRDKQGKGLWLEYRQALAPKENLYLNLSYYREPTPPREWWVGREVESFRENRYRAQMELSWRGWKLGLDLPSDPYFLEDFYFSQKERTAPYTLSYLTYTQSETDYLLYLNIRSYYDLTSPNNGRTLNLLPEASFYSKTKRVGPLFVNLTTNFTNFYSEKDVRSKRFIFLPQASLPFKVFGLQNYANLELINNFYFTEGGSWRDEDVSSFRFEDRIPLYSSFSLSSIAFSNTTELLYTFSPQNFDNPQFDSFDQVTRENNLKLRLNSSLSYRGRTFSSLFLEGGYNFLKYYRFPTDNALVEKGTLPIRLIMSLYLGDLATFSQDLLYDPNLGIPARSVSSLGLKLLGVSFSGSSVRSKDSTGKVLTDQVTLGTELGLRELTLRGSITRDNLTQREMYRRLGLSYRGACWSLNLDYRRSYYGSEKGYIREVFLTFTVLNLRDFKLPLRRR